MEASILSHVTLALLILIIFCTHITLISSSTQHLTLHQKSSFSTSTFIKNDMQYVKTSCQNTTYPNLCYNSLSVYATQIRSDPKMLASVALNLTVIATKSAAELMNNMSKPRGSDPGEGTAVADCVEVVEQAVDELESSIQEMGKARGSISDPAINDIQTWVSAALTDDYTCIDGLAGKALDDKVKIITTGIMTLVAQLTSIALAFINKFASSPQ
ncbi:Plant invertase/pectin methylesterase inhibitor superfamily protein [Euphorbia peplus]|nr:Plant invertase/pectin methylesterase inhibitor superfamily protein [Euphorbia peplus]